MSARGMDVSDLRETVVKEYQRFATSFTQIQAEDIKERQARMILGLAEPLKVRDLVERHHLYLPWHRQQVFRAHGTPS